VSILLVVVLPKVYRAGLLFIICVLVPRVSAVVAQFIRRFHGIVMFAKSALGFAVSRIEI
jgi:hypothetical protein